MPGSLAADSAAVVSDRIRLRICYTKKSKLRSRVIGVPPAVDFNRLSEMLPVAPVIRDARNRSVTLRSPQNNAVNRSGEVGRFGNGQSLVAAG